MLSPALARFAHNSTLVSGRLHLLNLERLERHFGATWPKVRERALAIAEQTVLGGLGPQDLQVRVEDTRWLFFFPTLDKQAAQVRCAMLAEKVFRRLIGDDSRFDDLKVETVVIEADGKLLMEAADPTVLIQTMLEQAAAESPEDRSPRDRFGFDDDDEEAQSSTPRAPPPSPQQWLQREPESFPADLRFQFIPVWDASRAVIATHACDPVRIAPGGVELHGYDTLTTGDASPLVGDLDVATFARARSAARELLRTNDPGIISFPVHCRTLELPEARQRITSALERSKPEERKLFAAQLAGLPKGAPVYRILQAVSFLRRYVRAVFIHLPPSFIRFDELRGCGAYGVICRVKSSGRPTAENVKELGRFCFQARRAGLKPVAVGLRDAAAAQAAIEAGLLNLQGEAIRPATDQPHGVRHFTVPGLNPTEQRLGAA